MDIETISNTIQIIVIPENTIPSMNITSGRPLSFSTMKEMPTTNDAKRQPDTVSKVLWILDHFLGPTKSCTVVSQQEVIAP